MKTKSLIQAMLLLIALIVMLTLPAYALSEPTPLKVKIEQLTKELEAKRLEFHIPGMAIAVVKDDQIIMSRGFGMMDLAQQKPVTTETLFSIGSSSKAFTATMMGMFVDQNKLAWDDLVSDQLPSYQFKVNGETLPITYRDMLSHRTGYTRNDLLWASGNASRELILKTATQAEPVDAFRKNFYYNNVMFLAAGEAMAKVAEQPWDDLLNTMVLKPLGMNQTTSIHEQATAQANISLGYQWNEETKSHDLLPRRNLNNVAPAGGIFSNVNDMAQWVRFQLNQGKVKQQQLISQQQLQETHQAQIDIAGTVDYGLGWMLRKWRNHDVIEHGGNIDGYAAQVALLPDSGLGFVLLTNLTATPLQQESINMVWEHLADQDEVVQSAASSKPDYQPFIGQYHANFGPFKDAVFTFLVKEDGKPAVDVPGQMVYELKDPDESGKWFFTLTDTISISFDRNLSDEIITMRMQQNGANFELPREGYEITPEVEPGTFDKFLGLYDSKLLNGKINAMLQNHRLTLDIPNQMAYELHLPDENGFRQFRIKSDTSVKFVSNESGEVVAAELYKNKQELVETAPKLKETTTEDLPSIDDIMKLRKTKARIKAFKKGGFELNGEVMVKASGVSGKIQTQFDNKGHFKQLMDFGVFGVITTVINEDHGSTYGINPYTELHGKYLKQAQRENPAVGLNWPVHYEKIDVIRTTELNGSKVYEIKLKEQDLPVTTAFVDTTTGDILQLNVNVLLPSIGTIAVSIHYQDYREKYGVRLPFKTTIDNPMMGSMVVQYNEFKNKQKYRRKVFDTSKPQH